MSDKTKICTHCNEEKKLEEFTHYDKYLTKLKKVVPRPHPRCKPCDKKIKAEYYQKNKEKIKQTAHTFYHKKVKSGLSRGRPVGTLRTPPIQGCKRPVGRPRKINSTTE
jgi:hypothetical protein